MTFIVYEYYYLIFVFLYIFVYFYDVCVWSDVGEILVIYGNHVVAFLKTARNSLKTARNLLKTARNLLKTARNPLASPTMSAFLPE